MRHGTPRQAAGEATESPADEARLSATQRELRREFPSVPVEQIDMLVEGIWMHYDAARVRDFVPLLVRTQAREELREIVQASPVTSSASPEPPSRRPAPHRVALQESWYAQQPGSPHWPAEQP